MNDTAQDAVSRSQPGRDYNWRLLGWIFGMAMVVGLLATAIIEENDSHPAWENETPLLYALSAISQVAAALAALIGFLGLWRLDRLRDEHNQVKQRVIDLAKETMPLYDPANPVYNSSWWLQHAQRVAETPGNYEEQRSKLGTLLPRLKALSGAQQQLTLRLKIFLIVTLAIMFAALVGFIFTSRLYAWEGTHWLIGVMSLGLAVGPVYVVFEAMRPVSMISSSSRSPMSTQWTRIMRRSPRRGS